MTKKVVVRFDATNGQRELLEAVRDRLAASIRVEKSLDITLEHSFSGYAPAFVDDDDDGDYIMLILERRQDQYSDIAPEDLIELKSKIGCDRIMVRPIESGPPLIVCEWQLFDYEEPT